MLTQSAGLSCSSLSRIAAEVLIGAELHRVDEDGRCNCVRARLSLLDQRDVTGVQRAHWSAPAPAFRRPDRNARACQFFTGTNRLHPVPRSVNLRVGGALEALWEKIKP